MMSQPTTDQTQQQTTALVAPKPAYLGFTGLIEPNGVTRITQTLNAAISGGYTEIYFCLNSLGGYVGDGIYLYNHIRALPIPITMHNTGGISSIAVTVFAAGGARYCSKHSMFMIHPTAIGGSGEGMMAERLESALQGALADDERTESILRERFTIPDSLLAARRTRDVHITPDEALKFGLVQGVGEFSLPRGSEIVQI